MAAFLITVVNIYVFAFIARAVLSWFPVSYDSPLRPIADFLHRITEPVLAPIRRFIPPLGGFDLSLLVAIFGINLILVPLIRSLFA